MQGKSKILKINYKDDIRRIPFNSTNFNDLKNQIENLFSLSESQYVIKYKDDEEDLVTIGSNEEFIEAIECSQQNIVRLSVFEKEKKEKNNSHHHHHAWKKGGRCGRFGRWNHQNNENNNNKNSQENNNQHPMNAFNFFGKIAKNFICGGNFDPMIETLMKNGMCKIEHNHICDGCDTQISGTRFHCNGCQDFDFCEKCFVEKIKTHDPNHKFEEISAINALKEAIKNGEKIDAFFKEGSSNVEPERKIHSAFCDRCNETIVGIRWKCLECANFDFCNACHVVANGVETINEHQKEHSFAKIEDPSDSNTFIQQKKQYEQIKQEKIEKERERIEKERIEKERERIERERIEKERLEKERLVISPPSEEKIVYPFEKKLEDLHTMGFIDRKRNIQLLIKNKGDIVVTIQDLLN